MTELEAEQGAGVLGSGGLLQTQQNRGTGAQGWDEGVERKGHGRPCYCWQEVAPFFPDGETEAQGGLGTCPRSLTVSQLFRG